MHVTLDLHNSTKTTLEISKIKTLIEKFLVFNDLEGEFLIELQLVGPVKIHQLNKQFRNVDKPTDCLSFPLYNSLNEIKQAPRQVNQPICLGSIVICPSFAKSKKETIIDLVQHSLFHLIGYDHETEYEFTRWEKITQEFLLRV